MSRATLLPAALTLVGVMSLLCFLMMGNDKRRARMGIRRIPEARLFLAAACFGAPGGVLGMQVFRHKTKHWYFRVFFPLLALAQAALLLWLFLYSGLIK